jgi:APA family basic amino acid/polyamine antiporter
VNTRGVARGARLVDYATMLKLAPLVVFVVAGASAMHRANFVTTSAPSTSGLGRAVILAFFACSGMEAALAASGEVREPSRTIPRAIAGAMASVTLLYMAIQVIAQGILGGDLARSKAPLADAMASVSPTLRVMMVVAAALSMFGWIGSDVLGTPRLVFAFARDGHLPSWLGRLHPRSHAPHVAILSYAAVAIALALTGTFAELAVLSTLAVAPLYIAGCLAAWRLRARGVALAGPPLSARGLGLAMVTGVASQVAMIALASRTEIAGLATAILGASLLYALSSRSWTSSASSRWK